MFRSLNRMGKNPERARTRIKAICTSDQILDKRKGTVFVGRGTMTVSQLEYMIQCAEETRNRKTW